MAESLLSVVILALIGLLCLSGLLLSAVSLSGTWLVALAALLARVLPEEAGVGWGMIATLIAIAVLVELVESVGGAWGVAKRGGSRLAGVMAIVGGILGVILGSFIPIPLVGSLIGMLAGSFGMVYWIERRRLLQTEQAAYIAWGSVISRMVVMFIKVAVTLGMIAWLAAALYA